MKLLSTLLTLLPVLLAFLHQTNSQRSYYSRPFNYRPSQYQQQPQQQQQQFSGPPSNQQYRDLVQVWEARNLEFGFPSERERQNALNSGLYVPENPIPIDVDAYYTPHGPRVFTTIPRFGPGVPYSLAYVTDVRRPNGTEIQPYPSYDWHRSHGADCSGLTSVYRVHIDRCSQMWVLDSGEIDFQQHCPPSLAVFNLANDRLIYRYYFPQDMYKTNVSRFITPYVDLVDPPPSGRCQEAYVYSADVTGVGFVVSHINLRSKNTARSWRVENKYTYPDPDFGTLTVAGESFELMDGVFGFSVTPPNLGFRQMLYFHSLCNDLHVAVPLDVVRNESRWNDGINSALSEFVPLGKRGIQCAAETMTSSGFLVCTYMNPIAIYAWNVRTPYNERNRVKILENPTTLQFNSGTKTIFNPLTNEEEVWFITNRLQKLFSGTMNYNEINYRIQCCNANDLLVGNACRCGAGGAFLAKSFA